MIEQLINLLVGAIGNLLGGIAVASIIYVIIDQRLKKKHERRSYQSIYLVMVRILAHMDYMVEWLDKSPKDILGEEDNDMYKVPIMFRYDPAPKWERWRQQIETCIDIPVELLFQIEDCLESSKKAFIYVHLFYVKNAKAPFQWNKVPHHFRRIVKLELVSSREEFLLIYRQVKKISYPYSSEEWHRKQLVRNLREKDIAKEKEFKQFMKRLEDEEADVRRIHSDASIYIQNSNFTQSEEEADMRRIHSDAPIHIQNSNFTHGQVKTNSNNRRGE